MGKSTERLNKMKKLILILGLTVVLSAAQPTMRLSTFTVDPNNVLLTVRGIDVATLYDAEFRPRVQAQIDAALAALPPNGITQTALDAAILAARTQILQQSQVQWSAADIATARLLEQQMLTRLTAELQARLAELNQ